jgi:hypothetical protein
MVCGLGVLICGFFSAAYLLPLLFAAMILIPVIYSWRYSKR